MPLTASEELAQLRRRDIWGEALLVVAVVAFAWCRVRPVPVMSIVLAAYLVRLVVGYQVPTAVQFANAPAWLTRPLVLISSAHEDAEPRAFQRRLEDAGFRVRIDEGAPRAGDSLIAAIATAILELERSIPVWV